MSSREQQRIIVVQADKGSEHYIVMDALCYWSAVVEDLLLGRFYTTAPTPGSMEDVD